MQNKVHNIADQMAAGSAIGYGAKVTFLGEVDMIVSIIAGVLVAASAGFSLYLNWQRWKQEQKDKENSGD